MDRLIEHGVLPRLLLLLVLLPLLGLSPRLHQVDQEMKEAGQAIASGSPLKASQHVANAASYLPRRTDLWELAGHYALQGGDVQSAIQYLERPAHVDGETHHPIDSKLSPRGLIDLGDAYQQSGDLSTAIRSWQAAISQVGPSEALVQRILQACLVLDNYTEAISALQTLVEQAPNEAGIRFQLGLLLATQEPEEALEHLEIAAEMEPAYEVQVSKIRRSIFSARVAEDPAYSLLSVGRALASLNQWELAAKAFHQATLSRPDFAEAWAYLGEARQHLSEGPNPSDPTSTSSEDGLSELQKAVELDPQSLAANTFLALYFQRQNRYDLALKAMRKAASLDAKNPALRVDLASLLAASGNLEGAYETYCQAALLATHDPTYRRYQVEFSIHYDYHIEKIALPVARRLLVQYPENPANLDLMAQVLIQQGDLASAERFLNQALQIDPNYAPAHLHLGVLYILQERREAAYGEFYLAASLAPGSPVAAQAKRLLETYFP